MKTVLTAQTNTAASAARANSAETSRTVTEQLIAAMTAFMAADSAIELAKAIALHDAAPAQRAA